MWLEALYKKERDQSATRVLVRVFLLLRMIQRPSSSIQVNLSLVGNSMGAETKSGKALLVDDRNHHQRRIL